MWNLRRHILRTYMQELQLREEELKKTENIEIGTGKSPIVMEKAMVLQVTRRYGKIHVSDGENYVYLNSGRERGTIKKLCKSINNSANMDDLQRSVFLFKNFSFSFDWDYSIQSLIVSLECEDFYCLAPNNYLEKHKRDKYISLIFSDKERESYKRRAMAKSIPQGGKFLKILVQKFDFFRCTDG